MAGQTGYGMLRFQYHQSGIKVGSNYYLYLARGFSVNLGEVSNEPLSRLISSKSIGCSKNLGMANLHQESVQFLITFPKVT